MGLYAQAQEKMIREGLVRHGVQDARVLEAMRAVPRHLFVDEALRSRAYDPDALPIGFGQTISQPRVVGFMSQALAAAPGMSVLEIGTGSGYQAAILAEMGLEVYSVERIDGLYRRTQALLRRLKYGRIHLKMADGTLGWPEKGPFDRILVTAGGPEIPAPLIDQLADPGLLLIPVGAARRDQALMAVRKENGEIAIENLGAVSFVDLVGDHGWEAARPLGARV